MGLVLIKAGASLSTRDAAGRTALHAAAVRLALPFCCNAVARQPLCTA